MSRKETNKKAEYEIVLTVGSAKFLSHKTFSKIEIKILLPQLQECLPNIIVEVITTEEGDKKYRSDLPEIRRQCD